MRDSGRFDQLLPWLILILALAVRLLTAWPLHQPGYTDAYYYAVGAQQLHAGQGFSEPFVWNYLDPPNSLPHAGYLYWMPLSAILGWLGLETFGDSFRAMQMPFVFLSALLPLVAYAVAWDLTAKRRHAILAALLTILPGFYAHMFVVPDNFAPFALAGSVCLWAAGRGLRDRRPAWFAVAGLAAGFGHLARADGLLLVGVAALAVLLTLISAGAQDRVVRTAVLGLLAVSAGYLLVMGPWFARNWSVAGSPLPGGGLKTLFLTDYDEIFSFGRPLTLESYMAWGWPAILKSKGQALLLNAQRLWAENLMIVLLPFSSLGLWNLRRDRLLWPFFVYLPALYLAMTFAFTFPGMRGGLFHSGGALLPFFFAAAGPGLEIALVWVARRRRGWHARRAWPVFAAALVGIALLLTVFALGRAGILSGEWNDRTGGYAEIGDWLAQQGDGEVVVMAGNAPAFTWQTEQRAIAVPNDPLPVILDVGQRYGARYLVLDHARPRTTDDLYAGQVDPLGFRLLLTSGDQDQPWQLYELRPEDQP